MADLTTAAVVSLFNPGPATVANAAALLRQVDRVITVDDGSPAADPEVLARLADLGCVVERLPENRGIAAALNTGINLALTGAAPRPDFILTMDQDSLLDDGYVAALLRAAAAAGTAGVPVGMVAPGSIRGLPTRRAGSIHGVLLGGEPIQSGLLIPAAVLERLGGMREDLFIDGVDTEFYLRCREAGLQVVLAPDAELGHALGSMVPARVFGTAVNVAGRPLQIRTAATWRYYYIFRNRLLLARRYARRHPVWALKGVLADYRHLAVVTLLAPGRGGRLAAAAAGVADGLAGRSGRRRSR